MCQVTHLGRRTSSYTDDWLPLVYPSPLREPAHRSFPKVAEAWDLERILADYVVGSPALRRRPGSTASRLQSYGHLLDGFISPATNQRDDELGGSLEARLTFPRRVIRAIRAAVGPDFVVGIRMSMDERRPRRADPRGRARGDAPLHRRRRRLPQRHPRDDRERRRPWRR